MGSSCTVKVVVINLTLILQFEDTTNKLVDKFSLSDEMQSHLLQREDNENDRF